jgi:hypothetical protein
LMRDCSMAQVLTHRLSCRKSLKACEAHFRSAELARAVAAALQSLG